MINVVFDFTNNLYRKVIIFRRYTVSQCVGGVNFTILLVSALLRLSPVGYLSSKYLF